MRNAPKDSLQRKIGTAGRKILYYKLDTDHWEFKEETGSDVGRDSIIELSENDEWLNHKIECQIKGQKKPKFINGGNFISYPLETKTIWYSLGSPIAFVLFVVDITTECVYFQCIQDYFIKNKEVLLAIKENQKTLNIHIPVDKKIPENDIELQHIARKRFVINKNDELEEYNQE